MKNGYERFIRENKILQKEMFRNIYIYIYMYISSK